MPVVTVYYDRLLSMIKGKISVEEILAKLPYLALDIEGTEADYVRIEYNPNRPDFSTDYGLARALNGILGFETGAPKYEVTNSGVKVDVDRSVKTYRPYIVSLVAKNIVFDGETIRQFIAMQEDLHNGLGRHRKRVSIGLHNIDAVKPPFAYTTQSKDFKFIPLGGEEPLTIEEILARTEQGKEYGGLVSEFDRCPIITDSSGEVLSMPPIINGQLTRVTERTRNIFVDITGTNLQLIEDSLAILCAALSDAGARIETVELKYTENTTVTPDMSTREARVDLELTERLLGLNLSIDAISEALERSRISVVRNSSHLTALIPRYRVDILHPVDLVEEVALGYGVERILPTMPMSSNAGRLSKELVGIDRLRETLVGLELTEVMNFSLIGRDTIFKVRGEVDEDSLLMVEHPKSGEHEILREELLPSLMLTLSKNIHETYPQRIFEVSRVFVRDPRVTSGILEEYHCGVVTCHSKTNFTEAKSYLDSTVLQTFGKEVRTEASMYPGLVEGRAAKIKLGDINVGYIGEVEPRVLEAFQLRTPVSFFEVNLTPFMRSL